jgi:hypothetical protein
MRAVDITSFCWPQQDVDGRDKRGHDEGALRPVGDAAE